MTLIRCRDQGSVPVRKFASPTSDASLYRSDYNWVGPQYSWFVDGRSLWLYLVK